MFDVIGKRRWFYALSALLTIPGLIFILISPFSDAGLQPTIDFTGGTRWEIKFKDPAVTPAQVEAVFAERTRAEWEADLIVDPATGAMIPITKSGSYFILDDRVRFVIFGPRSVQDADPQVNIRSDFITLVRLQQADQERGHGRDLERLAAAPAKRRPAATPLQPPGIGRL